MSKAALPKIVAGPNKSCFQPLIELMTEQQENDGLHPLL